MRFRDPAPALALLAASLLSACGEPGRAVFDASAVPSPPSYSADFKRGLAAEIDAAPRRDLIIQTLTDTSVYYDQIRRLKNQGETP